MPLGLPRGVRRLVLPLLAVLLLAGCAGDAGGALSRASPPPTPDLPAGFAFPCPSGGPTIERAPGVCVGRIEDAGAQLSEPGLAMKPGDPDVLAVGVHAIGATALLAPALIEGRVYVTEDGGATWRASTLPLPRGAIAYSDPALVFGPDGTLHASGLAITPFTPTRVFATSSPDLGRTWTPPVVLEGAGRDRNWNSVGPDGAVYVSSQVCCGTSHVSWLMPNATEWVSLSRPEKDCFTASPVAVIGGEPWLACAVREEGIRVFRLDRDARALVALGQARGMGCIAPRLLEAPGGAVVMSCYGGLLSGSADGGATWSQPVAVADLATVEDGWPSFQVYWSEIDPWGTLHLQLATFHRPAPGAYLQGSEHRVAHVALDPATFRLVSETRLTPEGPERDPATPASVIPPLGDDWWGIAFAEDHGVMVWTWQGGIDVARIEAVQAPAQSM